MIKVQANKPAVKKVRKTKITKKAGKKRQTKKAKEKARLAAIEEIKDLIGEELEDLHYLIAASSTQDWTLGKRRARLVNRMVTISESIGILSDKGTSLFEELSMDLSNDDTGYCIHSKKGTLYFQIRELERIISSVATEYIKENQHYIVLPNDNGSPDIVLVLRAEKNKAAKHVIDMHFAAEGIIEDDLSETINNINEYLTEYHGSKANPFGYDTRYDFYRLERKNEGEHDDSNFVTG